MLSYRHAFHAGNHADVLKHCVLTLAIDYLAQKDKPLLYIDTHAGAGRYDLNSAEAKKNCEYANGVEQLFAQRTVFAPLLQSYFAAIEKFRAHYPRGYPGSPWFAEYLLREQDRLRLFELHPQDFKTLNNSMQSDSRCAVAASDGFAALKALLPPPSRRALVLIDPPYELKEDYARVITALKEALRRFATGTYLIWYPLLPRGEAEKLPKQLAALAANTLRMELHIDEPKGEFGMYGSGMFAINPPWPLREQMQALLPLFAQALGKPNKAKFLLEANT